MLTRDQVRKDNPNSIAKSSVERRLNEGQIRSSDILEEGSYLASQYPSLQGLRSKRASSGRSGDTYSLGEESFNGVFLVDQGRFVNYNHPSAMPRGGVSGSGAVLPDYAKCNLTNYSMPKSEAPAYNNNNGGFNPETGMP